ncbi:MAG: N-acetylmuramoyl-L-alanine amidase [Clostridia bacterium]|nr:N-acetylmuramoyl-L-alanine amidase [Clostridia bacterium]
MKRVLMSLAFLCVMCSIAAIAFSHTEKNQTSADISQRPTVILDAGHGGFDGGAVAGDGTVEKDINLAICKKCESMLRFNGFNVIMTRTDDTGTEDVEGSIAKRKKSDMQNRLNLMKENTDAIFVSVHLNKFTTSAARGAQVFYTPNFDAAVDLGESIQSSIVNLLQPDNTRVIKMGNSSTYLLKNATVPAVIVECGFLSNSQDLANLKNSEYQSQMAFAIVGGITEFESVKDEENGSEN